MGSFLLRIDQRRKMGTVHNWDTEQRGLAALLLSFLSVLQVWDWIYSPPECGKWYQWITPTFGSTDSVQIWPGDTVWVPERGTDLPEEEPRWGKFLHTSTTKGNTTLNFPRLFPPAVTRFWPLVLIIQHGTSQLGCWGTCGVHSCPQLVSWDTRSTCETRGMNGFQYKLQCAWWTHGRKIG